MIKLFCLTVALLTATISYTQPALTDSLKQELASASGDTKIEILNQLMKSAVCSDRVQAMDYYHQIQALLAQQDDPIGRVECMKNYGTYKYCGGEVDSAMHYYAQAAESAERLDLKNIAGAIFNNLAVMYRMKGDLETSLTHFQSCYLNGLAVKDTVLLMASLSGMGEIYQLKGQLDSALQNFILVEKVATQKDAKSLLLAAKINIAAIYLDHQPDQLKEKELFEILALAQAIQEVENEGAIYQIIGAFYFQKQNYDLSLQYLNQGLEATKGINSPNINIHILQGIANIYYQWKEYEKAIGFNNQAIELAEKSQFNSQLFFLHSNNASNYLSLKRYRESVESCQKAITYAAKTDVVEHQSQLYKFLAEAYHGLGQDAEAYTAHLEYSRLNNEYRDLSQSKALNELQARYDTEKKETEIASLSQYATIQSLELKQKNAVIWVGLVMIVFLSLGVYMWYRQRALKTAQSQLELEQRFLRSQLNPHFISNALLAVQNFMLKNQAEAAATYLSKFSKLMRQTLENSRREFILLEDEIKMLTNFMDIHRMRMSESFDYEIHITDNIDPETDTIPPMFVQPFVENSIEHGMADLKGKGKIDLYFEKTGDYISIVVRDNGGGYAESSTSKDDHTSLSSTIIRERIDAFNKSLKTKIQLVLRNVSNDKGEIEGASVELKVPFSYI